MKRTEIVGVVAVLINLDSEEVKVIQRRYHGHMREPCGHAFMSMLPFTSVRACLGKTVKKEPFRTVKVLAESFGVLLEKTTFV